MNKLLAKYNFTCDFQFYNMLIKHFENLETGEAETVFKEMSVKDRKIFFVFLVKNKGIDALITKYFLSIL